jgi:glutamyl-Q tRNA(Asp) synthetase
VQRPEGSAAIRFSCRTPPTQHVDFLLSAQAPGAPAESFVIKRKDGLYAYHLAVVVDDAYQQITHVVRGRDLLDSTPLHIALQHRLGLPTPRYGHLPLLVSTDGQKLSKQNLARAVDDRRSTENLRLCLRALGQPDPPALGRDELLQWAASHWNRTGIPARDTVLASA